MIDGFRLVPLGSVVPCVFFFFFLGGGCKPFPSWYVKYTYGILWRVCKYIYFSGGKHVAALAVAFLEDFGGIEVKVFSLSIQEWHVSEHRSFGGFCHLSLDCLWEACEARGLESEVFTYGVEMA